MQPRRDSLPDVRSVHHVADCFQNSLARTTSRAQRAFSRPSRGCGVYQLGPCVCLRTLKLFSLERLRTRRFMVSYTRQLPSELVLPCSTTSMWYCAGSSSTYTPHHSTPHTQDPGSAWLSFPWP